MNRKRESKSGALLEKAKPFASELYMNAPHQKTPTCFFDKFTRNK
jgi:hypothetical protein